jgi:hypothetical protein
MRHFLSLVNLRDFFDKPFKRLSHSDRFLMSQSKIAIQVSNAVFSSLLQVSELKILNVKDKEP